MQPPQHSSSWKQGKKSLKQQKVTWNHSHWIVQNHQQTSRAKVSLKLIKKKNNKKTLPTSLSHSRLLSVYFCCFYSALPGKLALLPCLLCQFSGHISSVSPTPAKKKKKNWVKSQPKKGIQGLLSRPPTQKATIKVAASVQAPSAGLSPEETLLLATLLLATFCPQSQWCCLSRPGSHDLTITLHVLI